MRTTLAANDPSVNWFLYPPSVVALPLNPDDWICRFEVSSDGLRVWTRDWRCFRLNDDDSTFTEES